MDAKDFIPLLPDESVDLVITDPPYSKKFLYTYGYLADLCPRVMKNSSSLITIAGHYALPEILNYFRGKLNYRWIFCLNQTGPSAHLNMGIAVGWKPMLWFVKGKLRYSGFLLDKIKGEGKVKKDHIWQQNYDFCRYYIEMLTKEGDTVLDPFVGSGTVPVICKMLKRNFYACDIDKKSVDIATKRINQTKPIKLFTSLEDY